MPAFKDLTGQKFGMLTAIRRVKNRGRTTYWLFRCDCGNEKEMSSLNVVHGTAVACGCLRVLHGKANSRSYQSWRAMKGRCNYEKHKDYHSYGGRGIEICDRWQLFENFYEDMGERPVGKTLDRIDVNKGYNKKNCRWATIKEQANNKRKQPNG